MLKRPLPLTPTFTISFEQSLLAPPNIIQYKSFASCSNSIPQTLLLDDESARYLNKRPRIPLQEDRKEEVVKVSSDSLQSFKNLPFSSTRSTTLPSTIQEPLEVSPAAGQQLSHSLIMAEKNIAGPSRLESAFHHEGVKLTAPPLLRERRRKLPAKLLSPRNSKNESHSLQVKDTNLGSRSMPSSPMYPAKSDRAFNDNKIEEEEREQLRNSLRGTPRRRPSVPFGMRTTMLPTLAIPTQGARLTREGPPPIWQDPSEHILSGNGSSLQHARSVYSSGPVEVLPGLFLGDEFNARDDVRLAQLGITTILNVAKETTLPFQSDGASRQLDLLTSASLSRGMQNISIGNSAGTPASSRVEPLETSSREVFFTPLTSMHPTSTAMTPLHRTMEASTSFYLRNTTSTPNLHSLFATLSSGRRESDVVGSEMMSSMRSAESTPPSPASQLPPFDSLTSYSPAEQLVSSTTSDHTTATSASSSFAIPSIALPHNAVALNVLPSPQTGRTQALRYIKLPWTHDETDLAGSAAGGFVTGCSIIADALGVGFPNGQAVKDKGTKEAILVHCQCGVSRSATLIIAFVMQAAAYNYQFEKTQNLTGMHDCYEMVKELSSSISPNCSLIYQLVEWERYLSKQVAIAAKEVQSSSPEKKWGNEAMNEEDWTKMRMDEERKEREEEDRSREAQLQEAKTIALQKSIALQQSSSPAGVGMTGIGARRRRPTPSLTLASSAKSTADRKISKLNDGKLPFLANRSLQQQQIPLRNSTLSPALQTASSNTSSTSTLLAGQSPRLSDSFGLNQNAAERRSKHKRTFSSELPSFNNSRRSSVIAMAPLEDEDSTMQ